MRRRSQQAPPRARTLGGSRFSPERASLRGIRIGHLAHYILDVLDIKRWVVSQFEIFAAVRRRASPLRFPERRPAAGPLFPRAKPSPETRYGPSQEVPGRVDVAVNLDLAMRASFWMRTGQVFWDRAAELRAMLRGVPRVDHRKPATGPWPQPRRNGKGGNFGAVSPEGEPFGRPGTASLSLPKLKLLPSRGCGWRAILSSQCTQRADA